MLELITDVNLIPSKLSKLSEVAPREVQMTSQFMGRQNFADIALFQREGIFRVKGTEQVWVLGMDFQSVITLGLRAKKECELLPLLDAKYQLPTMTTDRGGFATIHSPGQLIIYPMIDLKFHQLGIKNFIDILFATTKEILMSYDIQAQFNEEKPGLYTANGKISFVGIKVDQGVVRHGIAINVNNDLDLFQAIRSCGVQCQSHDKISHYTGGSPVDIESLFREWVHRFKINLDSVFSKK